MIDVHSLLTLLDDEVLVKKYLQRFIEDMPRLLILMKNSYKAQNWNELSIHAHSFKSQMQYINEIVAGDIAYELEIESASSNPNELKIEKLMTQLEDQLKNILVEVHRIIE